MSIGRPLSMRAPVPLTATVGVGNTGSRRIELPSGIVGDGTGVAVDAARNLRCLGRRVRDGQRWFRLERASLRPRGGSDRHRDYRCRGAAFSSRASAEHAKRLHEQQNTGNSGAGKHQFISHPGASISCNPCGSNWSVIIVAKPESAKFHEGRRRRSRQHQH